MLCSFSVYGLPVQKAWICCKQKADSWPIPGGNSTDKPTKWFDWKEVRHKYLIPHIIKSLNEVEIEWSGDWDRYFRQKRKTHEFVVNKKLTANQYQGGTQPTSTQNGWTEKKINMLMEIIINSLCTENTEVKNFVMQKALICCEQKADSRPIPRGNSTNKPAKWLNWEQIKSSPQKKSMLCK